MALPMRFQNVLGASVGITASATDADTSDTVSYTLSDDAGGLFTINADGVVTVNGSLDYEAATSHDITVLASSTDGSFSSKSFIISVTDDVSDNSVDTDQYVTISSFELVSALATDPNIWSGHSLGSNIDPADEWAFVRLGGTFTSEVTDVRFYYQQSMKLHRRA